LRASHPRLHFAQVLESLERIRVALQPWQVQKVLGQRSTPAPVSPVGPEGENLLEQVPDGRAGPEEDVLLQEKSKLLEKAVAELPEPARLLLRLRFELGLTLQEIAHLSGRADHRKVHEELARILGQLQGRLKERGWSQ
jgi:RNA polymerase sigma factor (sigma-70 family)